MKGISVNGAKLHEVRMPLEPYNCGAITSLLFPKHRITFESHDKLIKLIVPTQLGLEMYRISILPQDENQSFPVCVSGKLIGSYKVVNFRYSNNHDDVVNITLQKC